VSYIGKHFHNYTSTSLSNYTIAWNEFSSEACKVKTIEKKVLYTALLKCINNIILKVPVMEVEDNRGEADRDRHQHHGEEQVAT
jgi:hypothetical protein